MSLSVKIKKKGKNTIILLVLFAVRETIKIPLASQILSSVLTPYFSSERLLIVSKAISLSIHFIRIRMKIWYF